MTKTIQETAVREDLFEELNSKVYILIEKEEKLLNLSEALDSSSIKRILEPLAEKYSNDNLILSPQPISSNDGFGKEYNELDGFIKEKFITWGKTKNDDDSSFTLILPLHLELTNTDTKDEKKYHWSVAQIIIEKDKNGKLKAILNNYDSGGKFDGSPAENLMANILKQLATKELEYEFNSKLENSLQPSDTKSCGFYIIDAIRVIVKEKNDENLQNKNEGYLEENSKKINLLEKINNKNIYVEKVYTKIDLSASEIKNISNTKKEINEKSVSKIYDENGKLNLNLEDEVIKNELQNLPQNIREPNSNTDNPKCIVSASILFDSSGNKYFELSGNTEPFRSGEHYYIKMEKDESVIDLIYTIRTKGLEVYASKTSINGFDSNNQKFKIKKIIESFNKTFMKREKVGDEKHTQII